MELIVLGSSSKGNCYLLKAGSNAKEECLVLEAGISFAEVKKALKFNLNSIVGVLCSHRHGDHAKHLAKFCEAGITAHANVDVIESMPESAKAFCKTVKGMQCFTIGGFKVYVIPMLHDVPCVGFMVEHKEMGKLLFATDTYAIKYRIAGVNYFMVEANYNDEVLNKNIENGTTPSFMRERLMKSHMEAKNTAAYLKECLKNGEDKRVKGIFLVHLSDNNSDAELCVKKVMAATGKPTQVLKAGDVISL